MPRIATGIILIGHKPSTETPPFNLIDELTPQLKASGFEFHFAHTLAEARTQALLYQPDLILLADEFGADSLQQICTQLRRIEALRYTRLLVLASEFEPETALPLLRDPRLSYQGPPHHPQVLKSLIRNLAIACQNERQSQNHLTRLNKKSQYLNHQLYLMQAVVEQAKDAVLITEAAPLNKPGPRIVYGNAALEHQTGYTPAELIGLTPRILQGEETSRKTLDRIRNALEKGQAITVELINYRKDGQKFWVEIDVFPVRNKRNHLTHFVSLQRNINTRKEIQANLFEAYEQATEQSDQLYIFNEITQTIATIAHLPTVLSSAVNLISFAFESNNTAIILLDNPVSPATTTLSIDAHSTLDNSLVGQHFEPAPKLISKFEIPCLPMVISAQDPVWSSSELFSTFQRNQHNTEQSLLIAGIYNNGILLGLLLITERINQSDFTSSEIGLAQILTRQLGGAIAASQLLDRLKQAKEEAEAANQAKSQFLAVVSHELRTPLNAILGYAQLIQQSSLTIEQKRQLDIIHDSGQHLLSLINDILDLSRIEFSRIELLPHTFNLPQFLYNLHDIIRLRAEAKGLRFDLQLAPDLPPYIVSDSKRLRQILLNMLSNAVKFTETGYVSLRVDLTPPPEDKPQKRAKLTFIVGDTGPGVSAEGLKGIFEPFHQTNHLQLRQQGIGLGLTISQNLVGLLGGTLNVMSKQLGGNWTFMAPPPFKPPTQAHGTIIWFEAEFPLGESDEESEKANYLEILSLASAPPLALVVDDNPLSRTLLKRTLSKIGCMVLEAETNEQAVQLALKNKPDIIFVDLIMPYESGFDLIKTLRQQPDLETTVIVANSASVSPQYQHRSFQAGADVFLNKPIQLESLFEVLETQLNIEWHYLSEPPPSASPRPLNQHNVETPPRAQLLDLFEIVQNGDIIALQEYLETLQTQASPPNDFINLLEDWLNDFQIDRISQYLEIHLQETDLAED